MKNVLLIASEAVKTLRYDEVECNPSAEKENINSRSSLGIVKFPLDEWKICLSNAS